MKTENLNMTVQLIELSSIQDWLEIHCATLNSNSEYTDDSDYGCVWIWG